MCSYTHIAYTYACIRICMRTSTYMAFDKASRALAGVSGLELEVSTFKPLGFAGLGGLWVLSRPWMLGWV